MRIEELSIGDWVLCDGEYWKISAITKDSVGLRYDSDYSVKNAFRGKQSACRGVYRFFLDGLDSDGKPCADAILPF
jgi:hypothetical protein